MLAPHWQPARWAARPRARIRRRWAAAASLSEPDGTRTRGRGPPAARRPGDKTGLSRLSHAARVTAARDSDRRHVTAPALRAQPGVTSHGVTVGSLAAIRGRPSPAPSPHCCCAALLLRLLLAALLLLSARCRCAASPPRRHWALRRKPAGRRLSDQCFPGTSSRTRAAPAPVAVYGLGGAGPAAGADPGGISRASRGGCRRRAASPQATAARDPRLGTPAQPLVKHAPILGRRSIRNGPASRRGRTAPASRERERERGGVRCDARRRRPRRHGPRTAGRSSAAMTAVTRLRRGDKAAAAGGTAGR